MCSHLQHEQVQRPPNALFGRDRLELLDVVTYTHCVVAHGSQLRGEINELHSLRKHTREQHDTATRKRKQPTPSWESPRLGRDSSGALDLLRKHGWWWVGWWWYGGEEYVWLTFIGALSQRSSGSVPIGGGGRAHQDLSRRQSNARRLSGVDKCANPTQRRGRCVSSRGCVGKRTRLHAAREGAKRVQLCHRGVENPVGLMLV